MTPPPAVPPPAWPAAVALVLIVVLVAGMAAFENLLSTRVAAHARMHQELVVLDRIRADADRLARVEGDDQAPRDALAIDLGAFQPSAPTEQPWLRVHRLLDTLSATPASSRIARDQLAEAIEETVDRLIAIEAERGREHAAAICAAHADAQRTYTATGIVTIALVALIAVLFVRTQSRQRLLVAQRVQLLDERARDLETFAERAAHDLGVPLNPIRGYADLLAQGDVTGEDVVAMAHRIRTAVDRMARVVDDMRALSIAARPARGTAAPEDAVRAAIAELRGDLRGAKVSMSCSSRPVACADAVLRQLVRSLLANAVKFRDRGRPLEISVECRDLGAIVELVVTDNGLGMDAETARRAVDVMYGIRADVESPGHGLGLAIVERASRALGGTCELSSAIGRGTRVVVRLPPASTSAVAP